MQLESKDLEYLLPTNLDLGPSSDLSVVRYRVPNSSIGPIVLSTPASYTASESPHVNPNATCWEILTLRLGRFAREYIEKHGVDSLTDKMLQDQAHIIIYGDADGWEQTAADNPEWLNLFKKAHGITSRPISGKSHCNLECRVCAHIYQALSEHTSWLKISEFMATQSSIQVST